MTTTSPSTLLDSLSALNDIARLRVLRLLAQHELSVGEIADILQLPQSTVSRHLKMLLETAFVARRTVGTTGLYRVSDSMPNGASDLWGIAEENFGELPSTETDSARLVSALTHRQSDSKNFFKNVSGEWESMRSEMFGSHFTSIALLSLLDPSLKIIDIGCGIGNASSLVAPFVASVACVDRESAMLDVAQTRPDLSSNIEFAQGDATSLPFENDVFDVAMFCLVLHHVENVETALREAARITKTGGRILIIDMQEHLHDEYKHTMGHVHLGFSKNDIESLAKAAGLTLLKYHNLQPDTGASGPSLFAALIK
jgi:ubiquinone/menaquinone biosynthesis C-methylase UbiE